MSFVIDSNAPYFTEFPLNSTGDAVYMTAEDSLLGNVFAIVYRAHRGVSKLSVILIGAHGTSGYVDMTLDRTSRFFGACKGLAPSHFNSPVRRALAIATLRTYATVDKPLKRRLRGMSDESAAGSLGSRFRLVYGKFPGAIGARVIDAGLISPKRVNTTIVDILYEDSDLTIDQNNELVHLLGEQLEQLFDPLSEYSPEPTERLYAPPTAKDPSDNQTGAVTGNNRNSTLDQDPKIIQDICEELYLLQAHARGDILDLLQTTLIPLRIEVLKGSLPSISIARLNSVFPPTIDELFRVNNIFYEALRSALPFGAFEVMRASGATIPYFFRACMRHEAATQNFTQLLADLIADAPEVLQFVNADKQKELVINSPSHLIKMKSLLDRLLKELRNDPRLTETESQQIEEFSAVASGTVDAFTKRNNDEGIGATDSEKYANRKLGSAGKVLGEIAQGWPVELEYGWLNRRVVAIFDAVDVLEPSETLRQLHVVFIVFTDYVVVCRPTEPIPVSSLSGLHIPSVGDMLMHAMLNDAPVDRNFPPLKVVSWAPILEVHFASYAKQYLYVFSPGIIGSYKLLQPESDSNNLVNLLAKAKITTKTQPFHLFRIESPEIVVYSTVQELEGYQEERNRTGVAVILSKDITDRTLRKYDLTAAISLRIEGDDSVAVNIVSRMRYNAKFTITKSEVRELVVSELAYLMTLSLSSQNAPMLDAIITSNRLSANRLIKWAGEPGTKMTHGHRQPKNNAKTAVKPHNKNASHTNKPEAVTNNSATQSDAQTTKGLSARSTLILPENSVESLTPVNQVLRKIPGKVPEKPRDDEPPVITDAPKGSQEEDVVPPKLDEDITYSSYSSISSRTTYSTTPESDSVMNSAEEAEQRDVDNWYHQLNNGYADDESLNSDLSDPDIGYSSSSQRSLPNSASIQIGAFLDGSASNLYNQNAGRAFPRIESNQSNSSSVQHRRQETESSFETVASLQSSLNSSSRDSFVSGNTTVANDNEVEDFSYLAALVDTTSSNKLSEHEKSGVYPDLRDTSLVRLGSYVVRGGDRPRSRSRSSTHTSSRASTRAYKVSHAVSKSFQSASSKLDTTASPLAGDDKTPTLNSEQFSAAPQENDEVNDWIMLDRKISEGTSVRKVRSKSSQMLAAELKRTDYQPFADVESAKWQPLAVRSGSNKTLGGHTYFPKLGEIHENSFEDDEDGHELAQDWLRWSKMTRPVSIVSIKTMTLNEPYDTPASSINTSPNKANRMTMSKSAASFRRMVMSSSLHTLQLASFTVQIEQKQTTCSRELHSDLELLKVYMAKIYKMRDISPESERKIRTNLTAFFQLLIKEDCEQLAYGLLEIEWVRRTRIIELGYSQAAKLWRYD